MNIDIISKPISPAQSNIFSSDYLLFYLITIGVSRGATGVSVGTVTTSFETCVLRLSLCTAFATPFLDSINAVTAVVTSSFFFADLVASLSTIDGL